MNVIKRSWSFEEVRGKSRSNVAEKLNGLDANVNLYFLVRGSRRLLRPRHAHTMLLRRRPPTSEVFPDQAFGRTRHVIFPTGHMPYLDDERGGRSEAGGHRAAFVTAH